MRSSASRVVAGTILERCGSHVHNTLLVAEPEGRILRYAKRALGEAEVAFIVRSSRPDMSPTC
jgi:hypothetical protein